MSIEFSCDSCGKQYAVKEDLAGKSAKCKCGAKVQIPMCPLVAASPPDDLFDELTSSTAAVRARPSSAETTEALQKAAATLTGNRGMYGLGKVIEGNGLAIGKIAAGAAVGGLLGLKALARDGNQAAMDPSWRMPVVAGTAAVGAAVASLLLVADSFRKRRDDGRPMPPVARLYFASRWLSILAWMVTVLVLIVAGVLLLAWMESPR